MARLRGLDAIIDLIKDLDFDVDNEDADVSTDSSDDSKVERSDKNQDELSVAGCSEASGSMDTDSTGEKSETKKKQNVYNRFTMPKKNCRVLCKCGRLRATNNLVCDQCVVNRRTKKEIDWNLAKHRSCRSAALATKRMFNKICELHAAHGRDVIILMHYKDGQGQKFRKWGTPGKAQGFLSGNMGNAVANAWKFNFGVTNLKDVKVRNLNGDVEESDTILSEDDLYVVEKVLMRRYLPDGRSEYFIKWLGYAEHLNSWEPEENILDKSLVAKFR